MLKLLYHRARSRLHRSADRRLRPAAGIQLTVPCCRGDVVVLLRERTGG